MPTTSSSRSKQPCFKNQPTPLRTSIPLRSTRLSGWSLPRIFFTPTWCVIGRRFRPPRVHAVFSYMFPDYHRRRHHYLESIRILVKPEGEVRYPHSVCIPSGIHRYENLEGVFYCYMLMSLCSNVYHADLLRRAAGLQYRLGYLSASSLLPKHPDSIVFDDSGDNRCRHIVDSVEDLVSLRELLSQ